MIVVAAAHFLVLSTALASLAFALAWAAREVAHRGRAVHPHTLALLYAIALAAPPLLAAWLVATAFLPAWWLSQPAFEAAHAWPLHDLHLLANVLGETEHPLAVASALVLAALAVVLVVAGVRGCLAVRHALRVLRCPGPSRPLDEKTRSDVTALAARMQLGLELIPTDYPIAFVWGTRRTTLVLSSGLIRLLSREQLRAVLAHEGAHHARRDNLGRLVLLACAYASLAMPLSRRILAWYDDQAELVCDEVAARATRAPLDLATALVSIRRSTLSHRSQAPSPMPVISPLAPRDQMSFDQRVRRLVAFSDEPLDQQPGLLRSFWPLARLGLLAFALTMGAVAVGAPLATHHAIETCLRLLG
jgi:Zn-dependent protease with chaperone function